MKAAPVPMPLQPAAMTLAVVPRPMRMRPMAWPTRTEVAAEMAKGTMKVVLAHCRATSWPASGSGPKVAMRAVTRAKMAISTKMEAPAGAPRRKSRRRCWYSMRK